MKINTQLEIQLDANDALTCMVAPDGVALCVANTAGQAAGQVVLIKTRPHHIEALRTTVRMLEGMRDAEAIRRGDKAQRAVREFADAAGCGGRDTGAGGCDSPGCENRVVEINRNGRP